MERLAPAENRRERLDRHPHDVVLGLLGRQHRARRLRVEAQRPRARVAGPEALSHEAGPKSPRGPELSHLLEEVVVRVEEERQLGGELVDPEARRLRRLHVGDRIGEREGDLLHRGTSCLAHVIAGDRDRVPARRVILAVREDVGHEPERGARREDVRAPRDELLQDVVLDRRRRRGALALDTVVSASRGCRRADRHEVETRSRGLHELGHIPDARDGHPTRPICPRPASASCPIWVGRSKATESPVCPCARR